MINRDLHNNKIDHNVHVREALGETPRDLLPLIKTWSSFDVPEGFDPDEISWVTDRLGITDLCGAFVAADLGHCVINTAGEIESPCDFKVIVDPKEGPDVVRQSLDQLADVIHKQLMNTDKKIVVHCFMGMERSVLTVVWYLHSKQGLSIDEAYKRVGAVRPIAIDHRSWALG